MFSCTIELSHKKIIYYSSYDVTVSLKESLVMKYSIPADIGQTFHDEYVQNRNVLNHNKNKIFILSFDHKVEHMNGTPPEHVFYIAQKANICLATHCGLIALYGAQYQSVVYIAKLTAKTNLISPDLDDPYSALCWQVSDVVALKNAGINICGVGVTVYLGSKYEPMMLANAARVIKEAHNNGLLAIIWMYPRGKSIENSKDVALIAAGAGVATSLGADIVKIKIPAVNKDHGHIKNCQIILDSAGITQPIIAGGSMVNYYLLLKNIEDYVCSGGLAGVAIGRNIFERPIAEAVALAQTISAMLYDGIDHVTAASLYENKTR
jgi:fructose-bisphosphate aldolase / 6-deoxy-5-ketofructose 1-phosphate synthase